MRISSASSVVSMLYALSIRCLIGKMRSSRVLSFVLSVRSIARMPFRAILSA